MSLDDSEQSLSLSLFFSSFLSSSSSPSFSFVFLLFALSSFVSSSDFS